MFTLSAGLFSSPASARSVQHCDELINLSLFALGNPWHTSTIATVTLSLSSLSLFHIAHSDFFSFTLHSSLFTPHSSHSTLLTSTSWIRTLPSRAISLSTAPTTPPHKYTLRAPQHMGHFHNHSIHLLSFSLHLLAPKRNQVLHVYQIRLPNNPTPTNSS